MHRALHRRLWGNPEWIGSFPADSERDQMAGRLDESSSAWPRRNPWTYWRLFAALCWSRDEDQLFVIDDNRAHELSVCIDMQYGMLANKEWDKRQIVCRYDSQPNGIQIQNQCLPLKTSPHWQIIAAAVRCAGRNIVGSSEQAVTPSTLDVHCRIKWHHSLATIYETDMRNHHNSVVFGDPV